MLWMLPESRIGRSKTEVAIVSRPIDSFRLRMFLFTVFALQLVTECCFLNVHSMQLTMPCRGPPVP